MLFGVPDGRVVVLDWQTVSPGHPLADVSYLIGTSVADPAVRKTEEEGLVRHYCDRMEALGAALPWDVAWIGYRRYATAGFLMAVTASMLAKRTERGDEMFAVMAERPARQMMDLDTLSLY
jgi:aminoglycoside phosphotransferase (APT) family kinase protein